MKKQLLLLMCLLSFLINYSLTFNDGVLEYTVTDVANSYVSVKKYNNICPTGVLTIPLSVTNLSTVYTVTSIRVSGFKDCTGLTSVSIPSSVTNIGGSGFKNCTGLTSINIPLNVTNIGNNAFESCVNLMSVTIPSNVINIGSSAFRSCTGLTSLNIPSSVTSIGSSAFRSCTGLTNVIVNWATPLTITPLVFGGVTIANIPLTVISPGTVVAYQAVAVWQDFGSVTLSSKDFTINAIDVQIYPNPAHDELYIDLSSDLLIEKITIYNNLGQLIKKGVSTTIDVRNLKGVYFVEIVTNKGKTTRKIIIE